MAGHDCGDYTCGVCDTCLHPHAVEDADAETGVVVCLTLICAAISVGGLLLAAWLGTPARKEYKDAPRVPVTKPVDAACVLRYDINTHTDI